MADTARASRSTTISVPAKPDPAAAMGMTGAVDVAVGDLAMDCGEQALLPAVRDADLSTAIVANGFSCKTQIERAGTGRRALHLAQLQKLAREGATPTDGQPAEWPGVFTRPQPSRTVRLLRTAGVAVAAVGTAAVALARR